MTAICSKCRSELSITGNWGGQEVVCPKCKRKIQLPAKSDLYCDDVIREYKVLSQNDLLKGPKYLYDVNVAEKRLNKLSIAGIAYCAFVIVNSVKDGGHRFYLHAVGTIEDMKKSGGLRSGSSDCSALSSTPGSVRSLAFSIFSVKGTSMGADHIERKC